MSSKQRNDFEIETQVIEEQQNNPLHGVKLEALLTELVAHYGFAILAEQININCFKSNPSISSSLKFLRKTPWARDRVEAFYLYKYKQLPRPSDEEHRLPPRDRSIPLDQQPDTPAVIASGEREFFDDPLSGPKPYLKSRSRRDVTPDAKSAAKKPVRKPAKDGKSSPDDGSGISKPTADPWAKWRARQEDVDDE